MIKTLCQIDKIIELPINIKTINNLQKESKEILILMKKLMLN